MQPRSIGGALHKQDRGYQEQSRFDRLICFAEWDYRAQSRSDGLASRKRSYKMPRERSPIGQIYFVSLTQEPKMELSQGVGFAVVWCASKSTAFSAPLAP